MRFAWLFAVVAAATPATAADITWTKTVLDRKFRSEGVAVADVNKDGKKDVLVGELWYEAPDWKAHAMQTPGEYGDGLKGYSQVFACWADDVNADTYPDCIVVGFPGQAAYWLENPKGDPNTQWRKHIIWHSACNETPLYADLLGTGRRVLIMGFQPKGQEAKDNQGQMAYFTPNPKDPTGLWEMHPISTPSAAGMETPGTRRFSHGLGVGDVNGDGRLDVLTSGATTGGLGAWWEQPAQAAGSTSWARHPLQVPDACADMFAADLDGDGLADVLATSAHRFGIWWYKQRAANGGTPTFEKKVLFPELVSETHAAHFVDMDGDGRKDLVTGKRFWSHGRNEPGSDKAAMIYYLKAAQGPDGMTQFTPVEIDTDSGIGTQFAVEDINGDGLPDVISSNKKGVRVIIQQRK